MASTKNGYIGISFHHDFIYWVLCDGRQISDVGAKELVQPFDLRALRKNGHFFENQIHSIGEVLRGSGNEAREAGVVLNEDAVLIKRMAVPLGLDDDSIKDHLQWEAEQICISPLDDFNWVYNRIPFQNSLGNPYYVLILVRKKVVEAIRDSLSQVGLILRQVDVDVFSDISALLANYTMSSQKTAILVDIQKPHINFFVIRNSEYYISVRIHAKELKRSSVEEMTEFFQKKIKELVFAHRLGNSIEDMDGIYFSGPQGSTELIRYLSERIPVSMEWVHPFKRIRISEDVMESAAFKSHSDCFLSAVGSALKRYDNLTIRPQG